MKRLLAALVALIVVAGCSSDGGGYDPCSGGLVRDGTIAHQADCEAEMQQRADRARYDEYLRESQEAQEREWARQEKELDDLMDEVYGP